MGTQYLGPSLPEGLGEHCLGRPRTPRPGGSDRTPCHPQPGGGDVVTHPGPGRTPHWEPQVRHSDTMSFTTLHSAHRQSSPGCQVPTKYQARRGLCCQGAPSLVGEKLPSRVRQGGSGVQMLTGQVPTLGGGGVSLGTRWRWCLPWGLNREPDWPGRQWGRRERSEREAEDGSGLAAAAAMPSSR